jgi:hypothetical protein
MENFKQLSRAEMKNVLGGDIMTLDGGCSTDCKTDSDCAFGTCENAGSIVCPSKMSCTG